MFNIASSLFLRLPFDVVDLGVIDVLHLRVKYDAGFVAYLNGREVARRNAPAAPAWNSAATAERLDAEATLFEDVNLTEHVDALLEVERQLALDVAMQPAGAKQVGQAAGPGHGRSPMRSRAPSAPPR